jgi:hypothetical protein
MHIKLMSDYGCYPLWWDEGSGKTGNIDPESLPLPPELIDRLNNWGDAFTATLNQEDPANPLPLPNGQDWGNYERQGIQLWADLSNALSDSRVRYFSLELGGFVATPEEAIALLRHLDKQQALSEAADPIDLTFTDGSVIRGYFGKQGPKGRYLNPAGAARTKAAREQWGVTQQEVWDYRRSLGELKEGETSALYQQARLIRDVPSTGVSVGVIGRIVDFLPPNANHSEPGYTLEIATDKIPLMAAVPVSSVEILPNFKQKTDRPD